MVCLNKIGKKIFMVIPLALTMMLTACGGVGGSSSSYYESSNSYETKSAANEIPNSQEYTESARKKVKSYDLVADTKKFDDIYSNIKNVLDKHKGYIDSSSYENRDLKNLYLDMRVPYQDVDSFLKDLKNMDNFNLISEIENASDVDNQYLDVEKRLAALNRKLDKLYELQKDQKNIDTILDLEEKIADTISNIEILEGNKQGLDNDIKYTRISLHLTEVYTGPDTVNKETDPSFRDELKGEVVNSVAFYKQLSKGLIYLSIKLAPLIVILIILFAVNKKKKNKKALNGVSKDVESGKKLFNKKTANKNNSDKKNEDKSFLDV